MPTNGIKKVVVAFGASFVGSSLVGCGLVPNIKELQPPSNPTIASRSVNDGRSERNSGAEDAQSSKPPSSPAPLPVPTLTTIPGAVTPPAIGPSQPAVKCTFQLECLESGNAGINVSGFCLNKKVQISVSKPSSSEAPVFPQCPQVRPIFLEALPTGKSVMTVEGGATLKASCDGTNFAMRSGRFLLQMSIPQTVCLELRDRVNALKL